MSESQGFPFAWVREEPWRNKPGQVVVLEVDPEQIAPVASIQHTLNGCRGIIRGLKNQDGELLEDHVDELLGVDGKLERLPPNVRLVGAQAVRLDAWTTAEHVRRYKMCHPGRTVVASSGIGNALANPHCIGLVRNGEKLQFFSLAQEHALLTTRPYTCLVCWVNGKVEVATLRVVSLDPLRVTEENARSEVTKEIAWAVFGPQLVKNGTAITRAQLQMMVQGGQFYDLRHVFLFGRIGLGDERWIDAGLAPFWTGSPDNPTINSKLVEQGLAEAVRPSDAIPVEIRQFSRDAVLKAMDDKGYDCVPWENLTRRGSFWIDKDEQRMFVHLLDGIYAQHCVAIRGDGVVLDVLITGLGNRVGMTLLGTAETLVALGARHAVLLDAGGDVMLNVLGEPVVESAEGKRDRLRAMLLWTAPTLAARRLPPSALRVVQYPKQWCMV